MIDDDGISYRWVPSRRSFACAARGYWIEDETGRAPYRAPGAVCRWFPGTERMRSPGADVSHAKHVSATGPAPIAAEGRTPAEPDSAAWVKVGSRD